MTHQICVRHNFETAHRLPHLSGKCMNLHGHSWWAEVTVGAGSLSEDQTVVEFGAFKRDLRAFIDEHLDHGAMLGVDDPLAALLTEHGSKVYLFGRHAHTHDLPYPTVEAVAMLIGRAAQTILGGQQHAAGAIVHRVKVTETHVNAAEYVPGAALTLAQEARLAHSLEHA
ncbi:6-pyruvoyl trahydropterin synthase family protein [Nonomuraea sp. NPDC050451]|uniref:6-pyruvoyl trahydropterin synthase family protein n=1 Tax=Nonomuraea sp. NPDC050451 TaxID=3364364 RepID=UPI0037944A55